MRKFLIGAAAVALAATTATADPGKGHGNSGGNGGAHQAGESMADAGNGHSSGSMAGSQKAAHAPKGNAGGDARGPDMRAAKPDRGPAMNGKQAQADHAKAGKAEQRAVARDNRDDNRREDRVTPGRSNDVRGPARDVRVLRGDDGRVRTIGFDGGGARGLIDGCPPGLAKKHNGCMPPGLANDRDGYRDGSYRPSWFGYSSVGDGRYYYDDGYLYRMNDGGSVLGYIPLLGGALSIGNPWPSSYQPVPVPDYYVQYYNLGQPNGYRYADDVLYRVDPQTDAITSIAALLTGDQFGIGQRMPAGYDVYNVPYAYRDQYYDTPQADYRYADGYVYEVDPTTQLIQAAIQLLT